MITVTFTVILIVCRDFGYRRDFASCFTAVKTSVPVLCVVISAFERSLMYTRKPCCGTETARSWCSCKIRHVSKFTAE